jgi:hypothetical protein
VQVVNVATSSQSELVVNIIEEPEFELEKYT